MTCDYRLCNEGDGVDERTRTHVKVSGVVQGVYFRASTARMAIDLDIDGWVRNLPDGSVEAVFEGPADVVSMAIDWVHRGPPHAAVESVEVYAEDPLGEIGFRIR
ncbi:MAG: acylphosphatase [Actinobacteria bacterium HGW-Actinobacteria-6]|nr:MAG: acylphosphatase [Actinobacteria bacterium HGW-Actinobacteria-6]